MPPFKVIANGPNWDVVNDVETDIIGTFAEEEAADKMLAAVLKYINSWGLL